ncbi:MAG: vWA domain-containing protein [Bacteriovoracaceae bacterium]|nr:vWA domain-containing protein [Bacteriovoracaceae bacterium]
MKKILAIFFCCQFLFSCNKADDYVYYDNPPRQERTDITRSIRNIFQDAKIDIVFIIDNSGSMHDIQQNIVNNAALFMQNFIKNNFMKWRMGVISTDKSESPYLGFNFPFDNNTANPVSIFQSAVSSLGTNGSPSEHVFYNLLRTMQDPILKSFYRPSAHLAVIMVTDEEEQSLKDFGAQYEAMTFLNAVSSFKDSGKILRFYGAFNFPDLTDCSAFGNEYYAGSPFEKVINHTSGIHMSACTADFGKRLAEIGKDIISIIDSPSINLNTRPKVETIEVYYDDILLPGGKEENGGIWYYDEYFNTINFYNLDFAPDFQDSKIRIAYDIKDGVDRE